MTGFIDANDPDPAVWGAAPVFEDDFGTLCSLGGFLAAYPSWGGYPITFHTTDSSGYYNSDNVSVISTTDQDGNSIQVMDVLCEAGQNVSGHAGGNNASAAMFPNVLGIGSDPGVPGMRIEQRIRVVNGQAGWHIANLLWPGDEDWPEHGEIDYYETDCDSGTLELYAHRYGGTSGGDQDNASASIDQSVFHVVAMEWLPGVSITWYVDGAQIAQFTDDIEPFSDPMRLVLQIESSGGPTADCDVQYDWVRVHFPQSGPGVQSGTITGYSGTMNQPAAIGDTLFLSVFSYGDASTSSSAPLYNGAAVTGAELVTQTQGTETGDMYTALWMLPNLPTSSDSIAITCTGTAPEAGVHYIEAAGLGPSPTATVAVPGGAHGDASTASIGPSGALGSVPAFVIAACASYFGFTGAGPGGDWANVAGPDNYCITSYQAPASSGGTYSWSQGMANPGDGYALAMIFATPSVSGAGDVAGISDALRIGTAKGDAAGIRDAIRVGPAGGDTAGIADAIEVTSLGYAVPDADAMAVADVLAVTRTPPPLPAPALATLASAPQAFIRSQMPRMHIQNLISGQWLHRDVQGITQPSVTWNLNAADSFSCVLSPPRPDMTSGGEPLLVEWRDAIYLEEDNAIKWGGILTSSTFNGPAWTMGATGFSGFPSGMVWEGTTYTATRVEAMDVVRGLWNWVQSQGGTNLGMEIPSFDTGYLLGAELPSTPVVDNLARASAQGQKVLYVKHPQLWSAGMVVQAMGDGGTYTIKSVSGETLTLTTTLKGRSVLYSLDNTLTQVVKPTPYQLAWWNSTDIGQEIESIRQESVFDWREQHAWSDSAKSAVRHTWLAAHPRLGAYRTELRFCEGENIIQPATVTRDGSQYAQRVIGTGYGQGSSTIRSTVTGPGGRLNRSFVYTDQTVTTTARMTVLARKVQASMNNIDAVTSITIKNHRSAPFGSFACGDDIDVILCTGWRNTTIKSRITSMTQDPTTDLMTLTLARSDSFNYLAESGQAGTA